MLKKITIEFTESICDCFIRPQIQINSNEKYFRFTCLNCKRSLTAPFESIAFEQECDVWHKKEEKPQPTVYDGNVIPLKK